jgi:hypothetical protein
MEVELSKRSVKDLKSILREHKKTHCKPYSKLNKTQLIELIIFYNLLEKTDMMKLIDSTSVSKPRTIKSTSKTTTKIKSTPKIKTKTMKTENPNKNLKKALNPIASGDQKTKFERLKIMYSCIIQKEGTSEQREQAKKIIEQFENDIKYRKSLFTNHVKYFNFYNVFKVELKKIIKMKDGSPLRNMEERNIMGIFWEPGSSADYEDDDAYHIGGEGMFAKK